MIKPLENSYFSIIISILILTAIVYNCSSSYDSDTEYEFGKGEYQSAKDYYKQNKLEKAIEELNKINSSSKYYKKAQSLLREYESKLEEYYKSEVIAYIKAGYNRLALEYIDKLILRGNNSYKTLYFIDSLISVMAIGALNDRFYDESKVYLERLNDSNRFYNNTLEKMLEIARNCYINKEDSKLKFVVDNMSPDFAGYSEAAYLVAKLDSIQDEKVFQSALENYSKGYNTLCDIELKRIKPSSLVYPKVLAFYIAVNEYYDSREPVRVAKYEYYNSIFSKYKSKLKFLRKIYDMGFRETDFKIGSTYDSQNAFIYYYELYDGDYLVTIKMWLTYALNWRWELFVETR